MDRRKTLGRSNGNRLAIQNMLEIGVEASLIALLPLFPYIIPKTTLFNKV